MLMVTRTVTVNAAFLQEIKEDNEQLRALLEEMYGMCQAPSAIHLRARRLASLLAELRDQLAMHFSLEEAYGYFEDPVSVAPHLSEQAVSLRQQHGDFYEEIRRLAERAEAMTSCNHDVRGIRRLARGVLDFHGRLQEHERGENELILAAYSQDLGVGD